MNVNNKQTPHNDSSARAKENGYWIFGCWQVWPSKNEITNGDKTFQVEPKALAVLDYLCRHQNETVSIDELLSTLWPNVIVTENTVRRIIAQLRKVLDDDVTNPQFITTIPRKGYRFVQQAKWYPAKSLHYSHYLLLTLAVITLLIIFMFFWSRVTFQENTPNWLSGASVSQITSLPGRELSPSYSMDGAYLAYVHAKPDSAQYSLRIQQLDTGGDYELLMPGLNPFSPVWSPDNHSIAFTDLNECTVIIATLSQDKRSVLSQESIHQCGKNTLPQLVWSADGNQLFFNDQHHSTNEYHQYAFDVSTQTKNKLAFGPHAPKEGFFKLLPHPSEPIWLLLSHNEKNKTQIWRYHYKNMWLDKVLERNGFSHHATICIDDGVFLFASQQQLFMIDDSGSYTNVPTAGNISLDYISCSPSMRQLLFVDRERYHSLMKSHNPRAMNKAQIEGNYIFRSTKSDNNAVWSRNDRKLAFVTNRNGQWQLAIANHEKVEMHRDATFSSKPEVLGWSKSDQDILLLKEGIIGSYSLSSGQVDWLTHVGQDVVTATWSQQSDSIYFSSADKQGIYRYDLLQARTQLVLAELSWRMQVSTAGDVLYFTKANRDGLWRFDFASGTVKLETADIPSESEFQIFTDGIYFHHHRNLDAGIAYWDFANQSVKPVLQGGSDIGHQFSVSADEQAITYEVWDDYRADIKALQLHH